MMFIVSVAGGVVIFIIAGMIVMIPYLIIRQWFIRPLLYYCHYNTYTESELIAKGNMDAPIVKGPTETFSNSILPKIDYPNIEKYFPNYKEHEEPIEFEEVETSTAVISRPPDSIFRGMTYAKQIDIVNNLRDKRQENGKLDVLDQALLNVLGAPESLERRREHDQMMRIIKNNRN